MSRFHRGPPATRRSPQPHRRLPDPTNPRGRPPLGVAIPCMGAAALLRTAAIPTTCEVRHHRRPPGGGGARLPRDMSVPLCTPRVS